MKKTIIYLIIFNVLIVYSVYAKPYNAYEIEKSIGMTMEECDIYYELRAYDYTKISEKQRLDDALNYLVNFVNDYNIYISLDSPSETPKCSRFNYKFYDYLFESLMSIKDSKIKNSSKYNAALFYYYFNQKNNFYELDKLIFYAKKLSNINIDKFTKFFPVKDESFNEYKYKYIHNLYKVIKFLNNEKNITNNLNAGVFYNKLIDASLDDFALIDMDRADFFNSGIELFFKSESQGSGLYQVISVDFSEIDTNKLKDYLNKNSINYQNNPKEIDEFIEGYSSSYDYMFGVFAYNKDIYVIDRNPLNKKTYDMYYYTFNNFYDYQDNFFGNRNNNNPNLFLISGSIKTNNFPLGDINKLNTSKVREVIDSEVEKNSPFIKDGKYDVELATDYYKDYICTVAGQWIYVPGEYYYFDIDNDGKDELLGAISVSSGTYEYEGTYTYILNKKTLKIEDNILNKFLQTFSGNLEYIAESIHLKPFKNQNINNKVTKDNAGKGIKREFQQKLYTYNGKNKILLYETQGTGIYIDILYENGKLNITADKLYNYKPNIDLKYKVENGRPVNSFKLGQDVKK